MTDQITLIEGAKTRWSQDRVARLGFLIGMGWDAKRVATDPMINSTPNNVHRQAQRFGLAFRDALTTMMKLPPKVAVVVDKAAHKRSVTREQLIALIMATIALEPILIDNILDDTDAHTLSV